MAENFSKLETETSRLIRPKESQIGLNPNRCAPIYIKLLKVKDNFFFFKQQEKREMLHKKGSPQNCCWISQQK